MPLPARNTLAVIGAGPVGLEAALAALDRGFDVHVFERGEVGAHPLAWGHVRMFTPWRMNVGPAARAHLAAAGWTLPEPDRCPTGTELVERLLAPLAKLPELGQRVHTHAQVVHVGRRGLLKGDSPPERGRSAEPFRLLVRDPGGRESYLHAFSLIDAAGVYGQPNWAGDGGIPARNELYLAPQMSYHVDDVLDLRRARYAGRRTAVIGGGDSAATTVSSLATLAAEVEGTAALWITRRPVAALYAENRDDPLAERRALRARARELLRGSNPAVVHVGGAVVDELEYNSATHRFRLRLRLGEAFRVEEVDQVIVNTGYGPDDSIARELQVETDCASGAPIRLAAALPGPAGDCLTAPSVGAEVLEHPEPDFFVLGHKSYGRNPHFLLETGYRQVAEVVEHLARAQGLALEARR